jgi:hypothetical protein
MLNNLTNFFNIIKGRMIRTSATVASTDIIPLGVVNPNYDGGYLPSAITVGDLAAQLAGDRLVAGTTKVILSDNAGDAELTFYPGDAVIQTSSPGSDLYIRTLVGDDIILESGDDIRLQGDQGLFDDEAEGGDINIYAGYGSDGNAANAGSGGDIRIEAGDAGNSVSGSQGEGGFITIQAGYTTTSGLPGGDISLISGNSIDGIFGDVIISGNFTWEFSTKNATLLFPAVTLATLPNPVSVPGARAMIADSTAFASGNFGVTVVGGGSNIIPVFSDGTNWVIG